MPTSRTTKKRPPATRKATNKPAPNAVRRKKRVAARKKQGSHPKAAGRKPSAGGLPSWRDLATSNQREAQRPHLLAQIENVSTVRFGLVLLAVATVFTLFIGHVHATQDLLDELQQARRENLRIHLQHNRLKGAFDQATGPSVVYERAGAIGLEKSIEYGPTIKIEGD